MISFCEHCFYCGAIFFNCFAWITDTKRGWNLRLVQISQTNDIWIEHDPMSFLLLSYTREIFHSETFKVCGISLAEKKKYLSLTPRIILLWESTERIWWATSELEAILLSQYNWLSMQRKDHTDMKSVNCGGNQNHREKLREDFGGLRDSNSIRTNSSNLTNHGFSAHGYHIARTYTAENLS